MTGCTGNAIHGCKENGKPDDIVCNKCKFMEIVRDTFSCNKDAIIGGKQDYQLPHFPDCLIQCDYFEVKCIIKCVPVSEDDLLML